MRTRQPWKTAIAAALLLAALSGSGPIASAQGTTNSSVAHPIAVIHTDHGPNSAHAMQQHYVVLVSLDGFRWDYTKKYNAAHLLAIGREGVWAPEGMIPSYPSLTFPNHYAIITGLYPEHNGLVANSFLDTSEFAHYGISDPAPNADGRWYAGVPLWSLAEKQGMRTACLFWPGSEAKIAGEVPTDYLHFDDKVDESARIDQVIAWLKEPEGQRPHFITLYYSDVDHAGHAYGPDSPQTKAAVARVDGLVGKLHDALRATGLPIDLIVVSDHGMVKIQGPWVNLDDFADLKDFQSAGPLLYGATEADRVRVYDQLKHASEKFEVYRRKDVPAGLHYDENPREGDPVVVPTGPYAIRSHGPGKDADGKPRADRAPEVGAHGFDPRRMPEMKASFFAAGPDIVAGKTVQPFENVNLYPWIAHILGLEPPKTDGNLNILSGTLRDNGEPKAPATDSQATPSQE